MNKLLKGSIAGAVGVALLLGGAGTFASWNNSAAIGAGTIKAGTLTVSDPTGTTGSWTKTVGSVQSNIDITAFRAVPGDVITYTKLVKVVATGDNLKALLTVDPKSITGTGTGIPDSTFATYLANPANVTLTATGTGVSTTATAGVYGISTAATDVTVNVTFTLPNGAAGAENLAKLGSANLAGLAVIITQN